MTKSQILYVEDDKLDIMYLTRKLKGQAEKLDLKIAMSFMEAKSIVESSRVDLVIADNQLEEGFLTDFTHIFKEIPFIVSSGIEKPSLELIATETGAYGYLEKPIDIPLLLRMIDEILWNDSSNQINEEPIKNQFDRSSILSFSGGDNAFAAEMIGLLCNRFATDVSTIKKALTEGDYPTIGRIVHNLKSSFLIFKQQELAQTCQLIETLCLNTDDKPSLDKLITELEKSGSQFIRHLNQVVIDLKKDEN